MCLKLVTLLEFADQCEFLEPGFEARAVGNVGQDEESAAQRPPRLRPFGCDAHGVAPRVGRVVERRRVDYGPVQEIVAGVVCIAIGIEDVYHGKLADGQGQVVCGLRSPEFIGARCQRRGFAAEVEALPDKGALQSKVRLGPAHLVSFAAGEAGEAQRIVETEAFVDLGIDVKRTSIPEPNTQEQRQVRGLLATADRRQTVRALIGRGKARVVLLDEGRLTVKIPRLRSGRFRRRRRNVRGDGWFGCCDELLSRSIELVGRTRTGRHAPQPGCQYASGCYSHMDVTTYRDSPGQRSRTNGRCASLAGTQGNPVTRHPRLRSRGKLLRRCDEQVTNACFRPWAHAAKLLAVIAIARRHCPVLRARTLFATYALVACPAAA